MLHFIVAGDEHDKDHLSWTHRITNYCCFTFCTVFYATYSLLWLFHAQIQPLPLATWILCHQQKLASSTNFKQISLISHEIWHFKKIISFPYIFSGGGQFRLTGATVVFVHETIRVMNNATDSGNQCILI